MKHTLSIVALTVLPLIGENALYHRVSSGQWRFSVLFLYDQILSVSVLMVICAVVITLSVNSELTLRLCRRTVLINLSALAVLLVVALVRRQTGSETVVLLFMRVCTAGVTALSALLLCHSPREIFASFIRLPHLVIFSGLALIAMKVSQHLNSLLWPLIGPYFQTGLHTLVRFGILPLRVGANTRAQGFELHLVHPYHSIVVYAPCGGFEGLSVFFFFTCLLAILNWPELRRHVLLIVALGTSFMLSLNVLRIGVFFMYGIWLKKTAQFDEAILQTFHSQLGFYMYLAGILAFYAVYFVLLTPKALPRR